ncbi:MAG TPA: protein kinase [Thermoanaerobaculia bacterium]|jgi:hypothetical protein|nr:protein kinase [Thermoanaerobaculia bacterium]
MNQIGKYAIVGQIGTGGFGVVYEGRDPFLKRRVAIKTCSSEEPEIRDRFFREAEIAGNLQHRNIVTVHDFGIQDGVPYLVQEYLTGEDLDRIVARREPLPPAQRVDILLQAARGLESAHKQGVIHRDVKPANIRLTADGTVKIMDFGIAKLSNVASHLTRTGMTLGTAAYLPPEQIRGTAVDHRADVFSFGVTAYELLTYKRPFTGKTISALFWELLQREPEPLTNHWPSCPPALEGIVARCVAKDPQKRYASFGELIPELEAVLAEMQRPGRGEDKTLPHPASQAASGAAAGLPPTLPAFGAPKPPPAAKSAASPATSGAPPAAPAPTGAPLPAPSPRPAPARSANERFEAALTTVRRTQPPPTEGLLGDVEEALAGAGAAAHARRARELLAKGDLEAAEKELAGVPAKAGAEVAAVRRQVARARAERSLAQAAALWQQGQPQPALQMLDQLLALVPDHQDAQRLRDSWRAEIAERERARAAAEEETTARRSAIGKAVAEAESLLAHGDLDGAEAVVAAAQARLGSHQPLRDLRRRIALARGTPPSAPAQSVATRVSVDASTVGVGIGAIAAAQQRIEAEGRGRAGGVAPAPPAASVTASGTAAAPASGVAWPRPDLPGAGHPRPPSRTYPLPPTVAAAASEDGDDASAAAARTRWLLLGIGAFVLLLVLALLVRWLSTRSSNAETAPSPTPVATASAALSPIGVAVAASPSTKSLVTDREATLVQHPPASFPAGVPRRRTVVTMDVLVGADGKPLDTRAHAGTVADPRLVAEAQRVARRSIYTAAIRGGVPAETWHPVEIVFEPPR